MNKFKFQLFLVFALLVGGWVKGQDVTDCHCYIKGIIKDQHTGQPIPGATIFLVSTSIGVTSDENGKYEIKNLCPGKYQIECRLIGYNTFDYIY